MRHFSRPALVEEMIQGWLEEKSWSEENWAEMVDRPTNSWQQAKAVGPQAQISQAILKVPGLKA